MGGVSGTIFHTFVARFRFASGGLGKGGGDKGSVSRAWFKGRHFSQSVFFRFRDEKLECAVWNFFASFLCTRWAKSRKNESFNDASFSPTELALLNGRITTNRCEIV